MQLQLDVIAFCVVLMALFSAIPYYREVKRQFKNWRYRRVVHKEHVRKLEESE